MKPANIVGKPALPPGVELSHHKVHAGYEHPAIAGHDHVPPSATESKPALPTGVKPELLQARCTDHDALMRSAATRALLMSSSTPTRASTCAPICSAASSASGITSLAPA